MKTLKVIVAGSRGFNNFDLMSTKLNHYFSNTKPSVIISGGARGADQLGEDYAQQMNIPIQQFIPDWELYGKAAGIKRNCSMAENADALVAFWDGSSRGTAHMIQFAIKKGLKVRVVQY